MIFLKRYRRYTAKFCCSKYRCYKIKNIQINQSIYFDIKFYYTGKITVAIPCFDVTMCHILQYDITHYYISQTIISVLCMKHNDSNKYKQVDFRLGYDKNTIDITATRKRKLDNIKINAKKYNLTYLSKLSNLIFNRPANYIPKP